MLTKGEMGNRKEVLRLHKQKPKVMPKMIFFIIKHNNVVIIFMIAVTSHTPTPAALSHPVTPAPVFPADAAQHSQLHSFG